MIAHTHEGTHIPTTVIGHCTNPARTKKTSSIVSIRGPAMTCSMKGLCRLPQRRALQHNSPWRCITSSAPQYPRQAAAAELTSAGSSREGAPRSPRKNCMFGVPSSWYITPGDRAPPAPTRAPGTSPGSGRFQRPQYRMGM